ncbi:MAG: NHL repeat-containing protein [Planctomycetota bacterium]|jgi:streptogramin lyase
MKWSYALALLVAVLEFGFVRAEEPSRLPVELTQTRWQPLPYGVVQVLVGPDGRTWHEIKTWPKPDLDAIKKQIAEEFRKTSPQINHARPLLFEPDGRVWFAVIAPTMILGYDGAGWISRTPEEGTALPRGRCLTRGRVSDGQANRAAGGAAWFLGADAIHRFDGQDWQVHKMPPENDARGGLRLAVSPQGELAVAYHVGESKLWCFRGREWREQTLPSNDADQRVLYLAVPDAASVWCVLADGKLHRFAADAEGKLPPRHEGEDATGKETAQVGSLRVGKIRVMHHDPSGRIYIAAESIDDGENPPQGGLIIRRPDGEVRFVRPPELAELWYQPRGYLPLPILGKGHETAWLPNRSGAKLLDLARGEFIDELPNSTFDCLHAVADDGTLFVSQGGIGRVGKPVMAYKPEAPPLPSLRPWRIAPASRLMAAADDGSVWTTQRPLETFIDDLGDESTRYGEPQIVRIVNDEPPQVVSTELAKWRSLLPGRSGVVVAESRRRSAIFRGSKQVASGGPLEVLEENRELLVEAFGPGYLPPHRHVGRTRFMLAGGIDGRLWCLREGALRLLVGRRWYDAHAGLKAAGSRSGLLEFLAPVGDGQTVFVSDLNLRHDGGRSFLGRLEEGRLRFTDAPHPLSHGFRPLPVVRDADSGLWVPVTKGSAGGTSDFISGRNPFRVANDGRLEEIDATGWAYLCDAAGNVWIGRPEGPSPGTFTLWRDGRFIQELQIPAYRNGLLFSDRPGSVYAYTAVGLQQMVAEPPHFREYRVGPAYRIEGLRDRVLEQTQNGSGPLVLAVAAGPTGQERVLLCVEPPDASSD